MRPRAATALAVTLLGTVVTGCSTTPHEDAVRSAAADFYAAVAAQEGDAACGLLTPRTRDEVRRATGKPCPDGLLTEHLPDIGEPVGVRVFGTMAQVRYDGETTFLVRFQDGWRVLAAGCADAPGSERPYDCEVQGG